MAAWGGWQVIDSYFLLAWWGITGQGQCHMCFWHPSITINWSLRDMGKGVYVKSLPSLEKKWKIFLQPCLSVLGQWCQEGSHSSPPPTLLEFKDQCFGSIARAHWGCGSNPVNWWLLLEYGQALDYAALYGYHIWEHPQVSLTSLTVLQTLGGSTSQVKNTDAWAGAMA